MELHRAVAKLVRERDEISCEHDRHQPLAYNAQQPQMGSRRLRIVQPQTVMDNC